MDIYESTVRAVAYYVDEAKEALERGDWLDALRLLEMARKCDDGGTAITHALRVMAEREGKTNG